jgi:hypothetical protein
VLVAVQVAGDEMIDGDGGEQGLDLATARHPLRAAAGEAAAARQVRRAGQLTLDEPVRLVEDRRREMAATAIARVLAPFNSGVNGCRRRRAIEPAPPDSVMAAPRTGRTCGIVQARRSRGYGPTDQDSRSNSPDRRDLGGSHT